MSIDRFFERTYDRTNYNCLHFVAEVWSAETGEDVKERLSLLLAAFSGPDKRHALTRGHVRAFRRLAAPLSPSLALMERPGYEPHAGVYLRGRVLHITPSGVEFFPPSLAMRGFTSIRFYA